jgi:hypothetical protein
MVFGILLAGLAGGIIGGTVNTQRVFGSGPEDDYKNMIKWIGPINDITSNPDYPKIDYFMNLQFTPKLLEFQPTDTNSTIVVHLLLRIQSCLKELVNNNNFDKQTVKVLSDLIGIYLLIEKNVKGIGNMKLGFANKDGKSAAGIITSSEKFIDIVCEMIDSNEIDDSHIDSTKRTEIANTLKRLLPYGKGM